MNFKKTIATFSLLIATTLSYSPRSEAIVSIASWNPPLMGSGLLVCTIAGLAGTGASAGVDHENQLVRALGYVSGAIAVVFGPLGMIVLANDSTEYQYMPLTENAQKQLGLSDEEVENYNNELDQVNYITKQVALDLSKYSNPTIEDSRTIWETYTSLVSPSTLSAMTKINETMFK